MVKESKYWAYQQASLSQKVSFKIPILQKLAGADREISDNIAIIWHLGETGAMDKRESDFIIGFLDVLRLSALATSEKINEITKLGFMFPKQDEDEDWSEDES